MLDRVAHPQGCDHQHDAAHDAHDTCEGTALIAADITQIPFCDRRCPAEDASGRQGEVRVLHVRNFRAECLAGGFIQDPAAGEPGHQYDHKDRGCCHDEYDRLQNEMRFGHLEVFHLHLQEESPDQHHSQQKAGYGRDHAEHQIVADVVPYDPSSAKAQSLQRADLRALFPDEAIHGGDDGQDRDEQQQEGEDK